MDEAEAVLTRLERIERLDRGRAPAAELLAELRLLVREAEAWAAREGDPAAEEAVERCRDALSTPV